MGEILLIKGLIRPMVMDLGKEVYDILVEFGTVIHM